MKKFIIVLVMFLFVFTGYTQMTTAYVDTNPNTYTETQKTRNKSYTEAELKEILLRNYEKEKGQSLDKYAMDNLSIPIDKVFENDAYFQFWWVITFPTKKNGVTYNVSIKHLYMEKKDEGIITVMVRTVVEKNPS